MRLKTRRNDYHTQNKGFRCLTFGYDPPKTTQWVLEEEPKTVPKFGKENV